MNICARCTELASSLTEAKQIMRARARLHIKDVEKLVATEARVGTLEKALREADRALQICLSVGEIHFRTCALSDNAANLASAARRTILALATKKGTP